MKDRKRFAKFLGLPVLAVSGFMAAAVFAGVGIATTTTTGTTDPPTTTVTTTTETTTTTPPGGEGCTPGYWKNHTESWAGTGFSPGQTTGSVFSAASAFPSLASLTLLQSLQGGGGSGTLGAASILLRAAVAAVLNSAHPGVDYPGSTAGIIADVNAALASNNRDTMLALASELDSDNNLGCPLN